MVTSSLESRTGVAVLLKGFAIAFAFDLAGAVENCLKAAEFDDEVNASLITNAGSARNIVDRIAPERHHVDNLLRRDAENFLNLLGVENQIVLLRVKHLHLSRDELHHVFVAGDDEDLVPQFSSLSRQRADDVVGFESLGFENGYAQRLERAPDIRNLTAEIFGHRFALCFVALVADIFKAL